MVLKIQTKLLWLGFGRTPTPKRMGGGKSRRSQQRLRDQGEEDEW
jgi:hypothetical protein